MNYFLTQTIRVKENGGMMIGPTGSRVSIIAAVLSRLRRSKVDKDFNLTRMPSFNQR